MRAPLQLAFLIIGFILPGCAMNSARIQATPPPGEGTQDVEAARWLERSLAQYREMETYRDRVTMSVSMRVGRQRMPMTNDAKYPMALSFDRSGRIALRSVSGAVVHDGRRLIRGDANGRHYSEEEAPSTLADIDMTADKVGAAMLEENGVSGVHPILALLVDWSNGTSPLRNVVAVRDWERVSDDNRPQRQFAVSVDATSIVSSPIAALSSESVPPSAGRVWIDEESGTVSRLDVDITTAVNAIVARIPKPYADMMPNFQLLSVSFVFADVSVNKALPDSDFDFEVGDMTRIDSIFEVGQ